ncbi:MAG TPA: redox-sensing transcriptional repressor Rex [Clostridia bacterium]|nr:redox-sensing transcriptional repressor Rex [Clostridia bacterium]HRX41276.1 redox-sensing transcriptional repressor Rex [Clostridia bacterium]
MALQNKKVSDAVIKRLPRYFRYLADLKENGVLRISSKALSEKMNLTASQIRQDLSCFGGFGQQGYGYNVELLYNEMRKILGVNRGFRTIIIGAGNLGQAIAKHAKFEARGYFVKGIFDVDDRLVGTSINGIRIRHMDEIDDFCSKESIDVAILTVPREITAEIADKVVALGIKGIWNFSAMDLRLPEEVVVENVHLSDSIMVLGYKIINN